MKHTIIIAVSLLTITVLSCTKSGSTTTTVPPVVTPTVTPTSNPESVFTLTLAGRTATEKYILLSTTESWSLSAGIGVTYTTGVTTSTLVILIPGDSTGIQKDVALYLDANKSGTGTGTYKLCAGNPIGNTVDDFVHGQIYTLDSTSLITITETDTAWTAGTLTLSMHDYLGNHQTATGNFKIHQK